MQLPPSEQGTVPQGTTPQGTAPLGAAFNAGTDELTIEDIRMATQIIRVAHIVNHMRRSSGGTALDTLNALLFVLPPSLDTTPVNDITGVDIEREDSTTAFADNDDEPRFEMMNAGAQTEDDTEDGDQSSVCGVAPDTPPGSPAMDPTPPCPKKEEPAEPTLTPVAYTPPVPISGWTPNSKTTLPPVPVLGQLAVGVQGPAVAVAAAPPPPPGGVLGEVPAPQMPPGSSPPIIDPFDPNVDTWYVVWAGTRVGVFSSWADASAYVIGISRSRFQGFPSYNVALERFNSALARGIVRQLPGPGY